MRLQTKIVYAILISTVHTTCLTHCIRLDLTTPVTTLKVLITQLYPVSWYFCQVQNAAPKTINMRHVLSLRQEIETTGRITTLYI
jgi:hypothetical protein